ncbi:B12-binding domain-containing radical SAM protein [Candidatus Poribacteria bacterium]|nr:B12-binding domain-containing radical SAM protein [Candidatus Poribacteria bacterium]
MICLVQVENSGDFSTDIMPLGLLHVGSALKNVGFDVRIIHCTEKQIEATSAGIVKEKPLFVGFSVMTGPQTLHSALLSEAIRRSDETIPIVWGGIHPSLVPQQCLGEDYIDFVVVGEGEETAIDLARMLDHTKSFDSIPGLGYKSRGTVRLNAPRPFIENLDNDKYRLRFDLLDVPSYFTRLRSFSRVVAYKTSRGCPYQCAFCYNQRFNRGRWRAKSPDRVIEEIGFLKREYGIDAVCFYDDTFFVNKKRAVEILAGIAIPAKTDIRIDLVDETLLQRLKEFGVFDLLIGVESGSDRILNLLGKKITCEDIKKAVKLLAKYDLRVGYSAITGLPTEKPEELKKTIEMLLWIHKVHRNKTITVGPYLPYPGTALYEIALAEGFEPPGTTKGWGIMDRWSPMLRLPWAKSDDLYWIREYLKFLNYRLPLLDMVAEFRLKRQFLQLPYDARLVDFLLRRTLNGSYMGKCLRSIHSRLKV